MREKISDVELILVHRIGEFPARASDLRRKEQKQQDVGDVQVPSPHQQPLGGSEKVAGLNNWTVDVARQITGNKHEEFGGVAEPIIAKRQPSDHVVRNVIEEDHPKTEAAEEIEPKVPLDCLREG